MKQQKTQSGFAHLVIITVVLALAVVGLLGFVFYQNFIVKKDDQVAKAPEVSQDKDTKQATTYKTYTDSLYNASFKYPEKWTLGTLEVPTSDDPHYNRFIDIKNEDGNVIAKLILGVSGIGGTCMGENGEEVLNTLTVLDSTLSSIKTNKPVSMILSLFPDIKGGYNASYSLTDEYNSVGEYKVCMYYSLFKSNLKDSYGNYYLISFGSGFSTNSKHFASLDDAKEYIKSDEYKEIKKMLLSLTF